MSVSIVAWLINPPTWHIQDSLFSAFSLALLICFFVCLLNDYRSGWAEMKSQCSFNLHFSGATKNEHMFISHLYFIFWEFCFISLFVDGIVCVLIFSFFSISLCNLDINSVWYVISKGFLSFTRLPLNAIVTLALRRF